MFRASSHRALRTIALVGSLSLLAVLAACHIEPRDAATKTASSDPVAKYENKTFDPQAEVVAIWDTKIIPAIEARAVDYATLRKALQADPEAAGARYGYRERGEVAPWNFATLLKGDVVEADTESLAGRLGVDIDGDGKVDAEVQIGPILQGTSVRDMLDFISFTAYSNQIEFAQLANAFNEQAYERAVKALPQERLLGTRIALLGTFTTTEANSVPLITPVRIDLRTAR